MGVRIDRYYYDFTDRSSFPKAAKQLLKNPVDGVLVAPLFIEEATEFCNQLKEKTSRSCSSTQTSQDKTA